MADRWPRRAVGVRLAQEARVDTQRVGERSRRGDDPLINATVEVGPLLGVDRERGDEQRRRDERDDHDQESAA
jgi:hypothetical protein